METMEELMLEEKEEEGDSWESLEVAAAVSDLKGRKDEAIGTISYGDSVSIATLYWLE